MPFDLPSPQGIVRRSELAAAMEELRAQIAGPIATGGRVSRWPTGTLAVPRTPRQVHYPVVVPRTFFVSAAAASTIAVTAGAINNVVVAADTYAVSDGDGVYIRATVDGDGFVTAVGIEILDTPPTNTETDGWTVLASVEVDDGAVTVTPLAWNYSQVQKCGPTTYLWGGFGGP